MARNPRGPRKVLKCLFCDFSTDGRKRAASALLAEHIWDAHLEREGWRTVSYLNRKLCLCGEVVGRATFAGHCATRGGLVQHLGRAALNLPDE